MPASFAALGFRALRHTFISNLARAGVHPRNAQALARHSTIDLTMNVYTHVEMGDLASDLESLPPVLGKPAERCTQREDRGEPPALIPNELAVLADGWSALPVHIRKATTTLAEVSE